MFWEAIGAAAVGIVLVLLVLQPLFSSRPPAAPIFVPEEFEETAKGMALSALKEIEFDRETGKLSDEDYTALKSRYTALALDALRVEEAATPSSSDVEAMIAARVRFLQAAAAGGGAAPVCPSCGPRPEPDAVFCSSCGAAVGAAGGCTGCGSALAPDSRFCEVCGRQVAARVA